MPDAMDAVQAFAQDAVDDALRNRARQPTTVGRTHCANLDCGEAISPLRQQGGAQLCIECQRADEADARGRRR